MADSPEITMAGGPRDLGADPPPADRPLDRKILLTAGAILAAEGAALTLLRLPDGLRFDWYALTDAGANLTTQALIDRGERPYVDFGFHYGLLALAFGRAWFALAGRSPAAYFGAMVLANALIVWGMARLAAALRIGAAGLALMAVALPFAIRSHYANFAHALEAALICNALAEHARGRRGVALALLTACCFAKPALGYFYGLTLLLLTAARLVRERAGAAGWLRELGPAAATGAVVAIALIAEFGAGPLAGSLLPASGAVAYKFARYGFFRGIGRDFWAPAGAGARYYLGTIAGSWLLATAWLALAGLMAGRRLVFGPSTGDGLGRRRDEVVACCALIHAAFVTLAFGNAFSWPYYYYVLILGLAAASSWPGRVPSAMAWAVAALVLLAHRTTYADLKEQWAFRPPTAGTAGLWTTPGEDLEWSKVLGLVRGHRPVLLVPQGGAAEVLFPEVFAAPVGFLYNRGIPLPGEVRRKAEQVAGASMIVLENVYMPPGEFLPAWPEFVAALDGCERIWDGKCFVVYRRLRPPAPRAGADRPRAIGPPGGRTAEAK